MESLIGIRVFADESGESHIAELRVAIEADWHPAPRRQYSVEEQPVVGVFLQLP